MNNAFASRQNVPICPVPNLYIPSSIFKVYTDPPKTQPATSWCGNNVSSPFCLTNEDVFPYFNFCLRRVVPLPHLVFLVPIIEHFQHLICEISEIVD